MKPILSPVLLASAALVLAGPAEAKEIESFELCGPSQCVTFADRGAPGGRLHAFLDLVPTGLEPSGRYYRGEIRVRGDEGEALAMRFRYDPEKHLVLHEGAATGWARMTTPPPATVSERLAGVEPFGADTGEGADERAQSSAAVGATTGGSGFPWGDVVIVLGALALAALALLAAARRRGAAAAKG